MEAGKDSILVDNEILTYIYRASNWLGVLSRGLLMPKCAAQKGATRTDPGLLGDGIYFANSASTRYVP
jgi:hypothetical protein